MPDMPKTVTHTPQTQSAGVSPKSKEFIFLKNELQAKSMQEQINTLVSTVALMMDKVEGIKHIEAEHQRYKLEQT